MGDHTTLESPSDEEKSNYDTLPEQTGVPAVPLDQVESKPSRGRTFQLLSVLISGLALFSDGYNIQVTGKSLSLSIKQCSSNPAYTNTVLTALYPAEMTTEMKTRLTNSLLIGDIFGMLFFGIAADRIGRRWGIIGCTVLLVGGVILATAAHGKTVDGMLWMMVVSPNVTYSRRTDSMQIGRGVAGVGAGGEYAVCTTSSIEAAEEAPSYA
jgi:MFS family permease